MPVFNEARHAGEFILSEASGKRSRENVTIAESQTIKAGAVIALLAQAGGVTATVTASPGGGKGALTLADPAVNSKVKNGVYRIVCFEEAENAGKFRVEDPNGVEIGTATVAVAFNKEIKFTIADGGTDFAVGDAFEVSVGVESPDDYQAVAYDQDGTDGSEKAAGIAIYPATTGVGETVKIAAIVRDAEVNGKVLEWPADIEAGEKAAAVADLASAGIIVR